MNIISLKEGWSLREASGSKWTPVTVPGSVLSALLDAGKIENPYDRENEYEARELLAKDYSFETEFCVDKANLKKENQVLVCEGLDTFAEVYLNGMLIGSADNMHRTWRFDCRNILQEYNTLRIDFHSALTRARTYPETPGREITQVPAGCMAGNQYVRKAHSMFGWDWGAQLPDMGIWREIYLEFYDEIRIENVKVSQHHAWGAVPEVGTVSAKEYLAAREEADRVSLDVAVTLEAYSREVNVEALLISPNGERRSARASLYQKLPDGGEICRLFFAVEEPKLWWPNGYGEHPLYQLRVMACQERTGAVLDEKTLTIGLRTIEVSQQADEWGREFAFAVNGVKIFAMGADYIPEDCVYPWITQKRVETLIKDAAEANYNMLRVWGGGYYPSDYFYDLCDKNGLIVWQDLMYACNVYALTPEFEESIRRETIDNVRRLRHHASLGLWCGNNEQEVMWYSWGVAECHNPSLKADYIKMYEYILPRIIEEEDETTVYWPSSPSSGGCFDAPNDENRGDCHYWDVWHGGKPFSDYRNHYFRFCSEFGFQSFPERKTINTFARPKDCNIFSPVMENHQKNGSANGKILSYLSENFRYPKDFESLLYLSQILQGEAMKAGVEHWRRNRGRCMGALYWQLNDNWPVASWSSVDYYGRWKALHYMARDFYARRAGSLYVDKTRVVAGAANESLEGTFVQVTIRIKNMFLETLYENNEKVCVKAQSGTEIWKRDMATVIEGKERGVFAEAEFVWEDGTKTTEVEVFEPYKRLDLPASHITVNTQQEGEAVRITLQTDCFAAFVTLTLDGMDVVWERNYFHMTSNEPVSLLLRPEDVRECGCLENGRPKEKSREPVCLEAERIAQALTVRSLRDTY